MRALLLIDLQRDFVEPGGALYFPNAESVLPPVLDLVKKYREQSLPIITTQDWHEENDAEFQIWPKHCVKDSAGAELVKALKESLLGYEKHLTVRKTRYSAFYGTNFEEIIESYKIDEVEVCGVVTHICVLFTVEELRNRGIRTIVRKDAVASYDEDLHVCALKLMREVLRAEVV
ncbi:MAG: Isochorismatase hydrolase [Thermotoga sp. 50_1627]|nr:MAG: Isochorismatase hydrolase [Thermotoga sp. 50_64]KUK25800.1 MAG: Isochorismatase hydrolase [Thermotoga sp. 50_1627]MDK2922873.1 nicotinamidase/pyrazinamidase [Pseudothermotoga sp.]HBT40097.1 cysteine hydrolase [Pseudothermotoga sp.]HCO98870.1 cysteine hydrolase [Pseudothermotoga sp.]